MQPASERVLEASVAVPPRKRAESQQPRENLEAALIAFLSPRFGALPGPLLRPVVEWPIMGRDLCLRKFERHTATRLVIGETKVEEPTISLNRDGEDEEPQLIS